MNPYVYGDTIFEAIYLCNLAIVEKLCLCVSGILLNLFILICCYYYYFMFILVCCLYFYQVPYVCFLLP